MRTKTAVITVAMALAAAVPAQAQFNPLSMVTSAVEAAAEDRSTSDIAADTRMKGAIVAAVADKMGKAAASITTDVYEADVLLTGTVKSAAEKDQAAKLAKAVEGVKKVVNELFVPPASDKSAAKEFADDTVIEKKIAAKLASEKGVSHTNWRWHAVGGRVFLFGRALSKAESAKVEALAKGTDGVTAVVNHVKVKPKK
ncbi:MAG: BON domain-containing protein [Magnetospirillum sp.]|nr:BON domain-containing protein [Magnetospirillum sp.]